MDAGGRMVTADVSPLLSSLLAGAVYGFSGVMFLVAGLSKRRSGDDFARILASYDLLPQALIAPVAKALPVFEIMMGLLLLTTYFPPAAIAGGGLLLLFGGAIAVNLLRGRTSLECGCSMAKGATIGWNMVVNNVALAALLFATVPLTKLPLSMTLGAGLAIGCGAYLLLRLAGTIRTINRSSTRYRSKAS